MLVVLLVAVLIAGVAVVLVLVKRGLKKAQARIDSLLAAETVEMKAKVNFYGVASKGKGQVRGLGVLALTPDTLVFAQVVPDRQIRVPRNAITEVTTVRGFLGKTQGRTLLKVTWRTEDGAGTDEAAWDVPGYEQWLVALGPSD